MLRAQLAAKEQQLAAAVTDLEAVEREAANMASAYDDDLAALERKRFDLLRAQEERDAELEQLAAKRTEASQAMSAAEAECAKLAAEVRSLFIWLATCLWQRSKIYYAPKVSQCGTHLCCA